jgi:hypothetical protein
LNHSEPTQPIRTTRTRRGAKGRESLTTARITVSWTPGLHDGAPLVSPTEVDLVRELHAGSGHSWTCADDFDFDWLEAVSAARCREVVLTARFGDNVPAKHLVLELAERLTFQLTDAQPLIRVLFLPTVGPSRRVHSHA